MRFIKNYRTWLDQSVIKTIIETDGDRRPNLSDLSEEYKKGMINLALEAGYDPKKLKWTLYYPIHFEQEIKLPFDPGLDSHWWFCKLNPGDMFPIHQDLFEKNKPNIRRFWMSCDDSKLGHVFVYGNKMLENYQAGDLFEFENPNEWHAACNLGFTPKISLQIVSYSESIIF